MEELAVVSVVKRLLDFISFLLWMNIVAARLPWILSYMRKWWQGLVSRMFRQDFRVPRHVRHIPIFIGSRVIKEGTWKCGEERELKHSKKRTCKAA